MQAFCVFYLIFYAFRRFNRTALIKLLKSHDRFNLGISNNDTSF